MFLVTYVIVWTRPAEAAVLGWLGGMCVRQTGHFFFEPLGFDKVNNLDNATKESIKVGFNVYRKIALLLVWVAIPVVLYLDPTLGGTLGPASAAEVFHRVGVAWLGLGVSGLPARTVWLAVFRRPQTGLAWMTKILTDPFHNVREYWKSPYYLLQGQRTEPLESMDYARR
jgi:hypothetical protein